MSNSPNVDILLCHMQGPALLKLFDYMKWNKIGYIGTNEVYGRGLMSYFISATTNTDIQVTAAFFSSVIDSNTTNSALAAFSVSLSLLTSHALSCSVAVS
jgi:hypothetical protein